MKSGVTGGGGVRYRDDLIDHRERRERRKQAVALGGVARDDPEVSVQVGDVAVAAVQQAATRAVKACLGFPEHPLDPNYLMAFDDAVDRGDVGARGRDEPMLPEAHRGAAVEAHLQRDIRCRTTGVARRRGDEPAPGRHGERYDNAPCKSLTRTR